MLGDIAIPSGSGSTSQPQQQVQSAAGHGGAAPPPKRRRTSSLSNHGLGTNDKGKRRASLVGFNDDDDDNHGKQGGAVLARRRTRPETVLSESGDGQDDSDPGATALAREDGENGEDDEVESDHMHCAICLSPIDNKSIVVPCLHGQYCFGCIRAWTDQSRRCPLCLGPIQELLYNIRSSKDFQTLHLHPLRSPDDAFLLPLPSTSRTPIPTFNSRTTALPRHALYGKRRRDPEENSDTYLEALEERALERRRYVYREGLYAKHVASNRYTRFKPVSAAMFANNANLRARVIKFVRRELQVFPNVDISFLTTYLLSIACQVELRSISAIRLISDFISESEAEHLVHEITTFARSPFNTLEGFDRVVQYGRPGRVEMPPAMTTTVTELQDEPTPHLAELPTSELLDHPATNGTPDESEAQLQLSTSAQEEDRAEKTAPLEEEVEKQRDRKYRLLQARLIAEYREAASLSLKAGSAQARETDLRTKLQNRLREEKHQQSRRVTYSDGVRALLMQRLEEEKRMAATEDGAQWGEWEDDDWVGEEEHIAVDEAKEETLRKALLERMNGTRGHAGGSAPAARVRSTVELDGQRKQAELKERLLKMKLAALKAKAAAK